jgi:hypothetical protein
MNGHTSLTKSLLFVFAFIISGSLSAQLECTIKLLEDGETFGVYVRPLEEISPSRNAVTGTGQITVVVPTGFEIAELQSVSGTWLLNARINAPEENPVKDYISFGFSYDHPIIRYISQQETLLFSFKNGNDMMEPLALIDNDMDPFAQVPNSVGCNPGNELSVFDAAKNKSVYRYFGNYESESLPFVNLNSSDTGKN